jgi:hypothetical protein
MYAGIWWGNLREEPFGRIRRRWEESIEIYLEEVGLAGMDWIDLAEDSDRWRALVTSLRVPQNAGNLLSSQGPVSFSGRILFRGVSHLFVSVSYLLAYLKTYRRNSGNRLVVVEPNKPFRNSFSILSTIVDNVDTDLQVLADSHIRCH